MVSCSNCGHGHETKDVVLTDESAQGHLLTVEWVCNSCCHPNVAQLDLSSSRPHPLDGVVTWNTNYTVILVHGWAVGRF